MKQKSKLIMMVTLWDIILTWTIERTLDFLVRWISRRFGLKWGQVSDRVALIINRALIYAYITSIVRPNSFKEPSMKFFMIQLQYYSDVVKLILRSHKRLHTKGILKTKSCSSCKIIAENKDFLQKFEPNPKLYPPFEFSNQNISS